MCLSYQEYHKRFVYLFVWWCLTPLSTIFQLYRGCQFYCWRKPEDREKTTDLLRVGIPLSGLTRHNYVPVPSQVRNFQVIYLCHRLFFIQWVEVRGDCSSFFLYSMSWGKRWLFVFFYIQWVEPEVRGDCLSFFIFNELSLR